MCLINFNKRLLADYCGYNRKYNSSYNKNNKKKYIHPDNFINLVLCSECNVQINYAKYSENHIVKNCNKYFIFCSNNCWDKWLKNK